MAEEGNMVSWQKLNWKEKMDICQKGVSQEDSLLSTYVTIYIALEAMLFAITFGMKVSWWLTIVIGLLALVVSFLFIKLFLRRGKAVDRWETIMYGLWKKENELAESQSEKSISEGFMGHYEGSVDRERSSNWSNYLGRRWWGTYDETKNNNQRKFKWFSRLAKRKGILGPTNSARWILITFLPSFVSVGWVIVVVVSIVRAFDC